MAKLYFRYGLGKSADICQTAFNFEEKGKKVLIINAYNNQPVTSKLQVNGKNILEKEVNFYLDNNSLLEKVYHMDRTNLKCILVDNAHLLTPEQAEDLFFIAHKYDITVIAYGYRSLKGETSDGAIRLMELSNDIERVDSCSDVSGLTFYYGAMNSAKTSKLLFKVIALKNEGKNVCVIKPKLDRNVLTVSSRIGLQIPADIVLDSKDSVMNGIINQIRKTGVIDYIYVDEAQFLTKEQIDDLRLISNQFHIPVICHGLKIDFQTRCFEGSKRLLEISDNLKLQKTMCNCGHGAIFNARKVNGIYVIDGEQICIDNGENKVEYESVCPMCLIDNVAHLTEKKLILR